MNVVIKWAVIKPLKLVVGGVLWVFIGLTTFFLLLDIGVLSLLEDDLDQGP